MLIKLRRNFIPFGKNGDWKNDEFIQKLFYTNLIDLFKIVNKIDKSSKSEVINLIDFIYELLPSIFLKSGRMSEKVT